MGSTPRLVENIYFLFRIVPSVLPTHEHGSYAVACFSSQRTRLFLSQGLPRAELALNSSANHKSSFLESKGNQSVTSHSEPKLGMRGSLSPVRRETKTMTAIVLPTYRLRCNVVANSLFPEMLIIFHFSACKCSKTKTNEGATTRGNSNLRCWLISFHFTFSLPGLCSLPSFNPQKRRVSQRVTLQLKVGQSVRLGVEPLRDS
jgi:hypothetical protein